MNGIEMSSIKLTNPAEHATITVWGSSSCTLAILAIGGGGSE